MVASTRSNAGIDRRRCSQKGAKRERHAEELSASQAVSDGDNRHGEIENLDRGGGFARSQGTSRVPNTATNPTSTANLPRPAPTPLHVGPAGVDVRLAASMGSRISTITVKTSSTTSQPIANGLRRGELMMVGQHASEHRGAGTEKASPTTAACTSQADQVAVHHHRRGHQALHHRARHGDLPQPRKVHGS